MEENKIIAIDDDGAEIELFIMDSVIYRDTMYVIAISEEDDEDDSEDVIDATLLKQVKSEEDYITYSFVEDDEEFNTVMAMFEENEEYEFEGE